MNIIGSLIWILFGVGFIWAGKKVYGKRDTIDYSRYPTAEGVVLGTHEYNGSRWMVEFKDENGNDVIGADDKYAQSTFHPEKYCLPRRGECERVYYWKHNHTNSGYCINNVPVIYNIHFCNGDFYELQKKVYVRNKRIFVGIGIIMILLGLIILLGAR